MAQSIKCQMIAFSISEIMTSQEDIELNIRTSDRIMNIYYNYAKENQPCLILIKDLDAIVNGKIAFTL